MSENTLHNRSSDLDAPPPAKETGSIDHPSARARTFRPVRVLLIGVSLVLLFVAAVLFFGYYDGFELLASLTRPALAPASGQVFFGGEPLSDAQLQTQPTRSGLQGAIGFIDAEGRFTLKTMIEGDFVDGAYVGKHKVIVTDRGEPRGSAAGPLLTPEKYASFETTPLEIDIGKDPSGNRFEFQLEGEAPPDSAVPSPGPPREDRRPDPEELAARNFDPHDTDQDGNLTFEERQKMLGMERAGIEPADLNGDGVIERAEYIQGLQP